ncbi:MAG: hypothetical protein IJT44_07115 [Clostridia bacterium]|nr:hypothetical protein [Clostridia bacterium]
MARIGQYVSGVFSQRIRSVYTSADGLPSDRVMCVLPDTDGTVYVGTDAGLFRMDEDGFCPVCEDTLCAPVHRIRRFSDGSLAVLSENRFFALRGGALSLLREFPDRVADFSNARGLYWFLTEAELLCIDPLTNEVWVRRNLEGGRGHCLAVNDTDIYISTDSFLSTVHGKRREWKNIVPDFCDMPDKTAHTLCFDGAGYLWLGTEDGAAIYDNTNLWLTGESLSQLPQNAVYAIAHDAVGGVWFASDVGVICLKRGALKYYSADRWVPCGRVNDLAVMADGETVYAATNKGLSVISACPMTLADKADLFEDTIERYHVRRGFVATRIIRGYDMNSGEVQISDNDGLWTACHVAAESFRYAVTGDPTALSRARRGMQALLLLQRISGIPGFTARAVRYPGETGFGNGHNEWRPAPDGTCEWKGETSSDEMTGHFFGGCIYYDLCASDDEKPVIRDALCGIMEHIIRSGYRLVDADGLPTTWACWDPALLNNDDKWAFERGVNSLELLAFLKVCAHISGDRKYETLYQRFVHLHHYPLNAARHKIRDAHICHIDDNLAFLASFTLLRLERDSAVRALILCGMEDHWQYERVERQPLFAFIHALFTERDADLAEGVQTLREIPLDMIHYAMENSKRKGLTFDTQQEAWHEAPQVLSPLPYDERNVHRPDNGGFALDAAGGDRAQEPTMFLRPYWLGRYFGLLREASEL